MRRSDDIGIHAYVDTRFSDLNAYVQQLHDQLDLRLQQRYDSQEANIAVALEAWRTAYGRDERDTERRFEEIDERYKQMFSALDQQIKTALISANLTTLTTDELMKERDRRYMALFAASDAAVAAALTASHEATSKAESAAEKRFEAVNEFRTTLSDQATLFLNRSEYDVAIANVTERVRDLSSRMDRSDGKGAGLNAGWGYLVGGVGFFVAVVALAFNIFYRISG